MDEYERAINDLINTTAAGPIFHGYRDELVALLRTTAHDAAAAQRERDAEIAEQCTLFRY